jgi:hypothetical protein
MQFSRPMAACFMVTRVFLRFLRRKIVCPSTKLKGVVAQEGRFNFSVIEIWSSCVEKSIVCPYRCTFADPRQMEYMCHSGDCVCFPLWNGLDRTSLVLGSTLGHSGEPIPGCKPQYRLCYCSSSSRGRQFVVVATHAIQERKYRLLSQCLCKHRNS